MAQAEFSPSRGNRTATFNNSRGSPGSRTLERPAGMPFLPGFTFTDPKRTDFHKAHVFDAKNGYGTMREPPGTRGPVGGARVDTSQFPRLETPSLGVRDRGFASDFQPHFVEYHHKALRFFAYFKEAVPESPLEQYRIRKCHIVYHLEDHTISIGEPKEENSGMPQGRFLRRNHIAKTGKGNLQEPASTAGHTFYNFTDFNIACEMTFFGRTYRIYDCDEFTHDFMTKQGIALNPPEACPHDRYADTRRQGTHLVRQRAIETRDTLRQFLDHDRKVLKFMGVWDNRDAVYGDKNYYIVYYFLADDTIQVVKQKDTSLSAENDPFVSLLKRRRLPKTIVTPDFSDRQIEYYSEMDLQVGRNLHILGRQVFLYDCDQYTRYHYRTKFGHEQAPFVDVSDPSYSVPKPAIPPHTGFGTEEDSMVSVKHLHLKAPRRDFRKFLLKDGQVLRFGAYLDTPQPEDQDRRFIIGVYMMDEPVTVAVYEIRARNSGRFGGKFLQRQRVMKPGTNQSYAPGDFFVGSKIEIYSHRFVLTQADEYSLNYMENEDYEFPKANLDLICEKLRELMERTGESPRQLFESADRENSGYVTVDQFKNLLGRCGVLRHLAEQEVITLTRIFDRNGDGRISIEEFLGVVLAHDNENNNNAQGTTTTTAAPADDTQQRAAEAQRLEEATARVLRTLREKVFNRRTTLERKLREADKDGDGHITPDLLRAGLETLAVYLTDGEMQILRSNFSSPQSSLIRWRDFVRAICT